MCLTVDDAYITDIQEANAEKLQAIFKFSTLTAYKGVPTYNVTVEICDQSIQNSLAVNSPLGGGKHGHMGMVVPAPSYLQYTGDPWVVPQSGGV